MVGAVLLGLPLVGVVVSGQPVGRYLEFPPVTQYVEHAGFNWAVFAVLAVTILLAVGPFKIQVSIHSLGMKRTGPERRFPFWGWLGLAWIAWSWIVAWNRFPWMEMLQAHTFVPLWAGYIVVVNALTYRRRGICMLTHRPGYFLALFPLSAAFWWFFEYLNRFVQNWHYIGSQDFSPLEYLVYATLPFATVLPAVLGTHDLLATYPRLSAGLRNFWRLEIRRGKRAARDVLLPAAAGLALIGVWPDYLFPLLWLAPLMILVSLQILLGRPTVFSGVRNGDWRRIYLLAVSALICGFFWEMWNYHSAAKWIYSVPFVGRFRIFEMPILGYAGYLPFGLECAVVADWFLGYLQTTETEEENPRFY